MYTISSILIWSHYYLIGFLWFEESPNFIYIFLELKEKHNENPGFIYT